MTSRPFTTALLLATLLAAGCMGEPEAPAPATKPAATYREDTESFAIPAGKSVEYKLFMQEGDSMEFTWSAPRALYFDFHGDREGDASGAFTRHKSGTATLDKGAFTSPFQGRHGWYWENRNGESVTVTLTTKGDYLVVGVVG